VKRKSLVAAFIASLAVVLTAGPAAATHANSKYCDSKSPVLTGSHYCQP
jgi:hypothetical protein